MALKTDKWLPETYLRAINYGPGTIEFSAHLVADKSRKGKTFVIQPKTDVFFQVKELIPVSAEELQKLTGKDISFTMHNTGKENSKFNVMDEGPYRSEVAARKYDNPYQKVVDQYQEALHNEDFYTMKQIMNTPVPEQWKTSPMVYSVVCFLRAKIFRNFLRLPEADASFEAGWEGFPEKDKWGYAFDWTGCSLAYLMDANATAAQKGKGMQKAIEILNRIDKLVEGMKFEKYHRMAAACVRAFILCYLDEEEQALAEFDEMDFSPLPAEVFSDKDLAHFFNYLPFGFWAAVEMKNAGLIRNLSSIISTGFPDMLLEPSPIRCLRRAFGNASEKGRAEMDQATNNLTRFGHQYAPELPNLRQFIIYLNEKDESSLEKFIAYVE